MIANTSSLETFASTGFLLLVAHNLADHVTGQCDWQAAGKGAPTPEEVAAGAHPRRGWLPNLAHVAQYHLTVIVLGFLAWLVLPVQWSPTGVAAALAWSGGTHALVDRRWPVRWILESTGSRAFARLDTGMYAADQALHHFALGVSAVLLAVLR